MTAPSSKKPRFVKPPNILKDKVGAGGIDPSRIDKAQALIESVNADYVPYAKNYLQEFSSALKNIDSSNDNQQQKKHHIIGPVMQLKASGGMFQYQLLSDVADIALQFLENVEEMNADAVEVLRAHEHTIEAIIKNALTGDGGREGYALVVELDKACKRYFSKHKKP